MRRRIIIGFTLGCLLMPVLLTSCTQPGRINSPSTTAPSTSSINLNGSDQAAMPDEIIYQTGNRNITFAGKQFDTIYALTNERLKGAKILSMSAIPYLDFTPTLSGIDTLEFDYHTVQTLSFIYNGINPGGPMLLPGKKPAIMHTDIKFTKLFFPLTDYSKSISGEYEYSHCFFSNGSPGDSIEINGVTGTPIYQNYSISSPEKLISYLNTEKTYLASGSGFDR